MIITARAICLGRQKFRAPAEIKNHRSRSCAGNAGRRGLGGRVLSAGRCLSASYPRDLRHVAESAGLSGAEKQSTETTLEGKRSSLASGAGLTFADTHRISERRGFALRSVGTHQTAGGIARAGREASLQKDKGFMRPRNGNSVVEGYGPSTWQYANAVGRSVLARKNATQYIILRAGPSFRRCVLSFQTSRCFVSSATNSFIQEKTSTESFFDSVVEGEL